jgi:thiol-disulfide isomerase/thioredoxin
MIKSKTLIILMVLLYSGLAEHTHAAGSIESYEGSLAQPWLALQDPDHRLHSLTDYRDKVILVNFWASWCVPCVVEMPGMQRLADRLKDQPFEILAVNVSDTENRVREFIKRMNLHLTILMDRDGEALKAWQGKVLPASFILDRSGRIRYQVIGPFEWDSDEAGTIIEQLIRQQ